VGVLQQTTAPNKRSGWTKDDDATAAASAATRQLLPSQLLTQATADTLLKAPHGDCAVLRKHLLSTAANCQSTLLKQRWHSYGQFEGFGGAAPPMKRGAIRWIMFQCKVS
jgi:hypothetical protein